MRAELRAEIAFDPREGLDHKQGPDEIEFENAPGMPPGPHPSRPVGVEARSI